MGTRNKTLISLLLLIFLSFSGNIWTQERQKTDKIAFADFLAIYHSYYKTKIEDNRLREKGIQLKGTIDTEKNKITELENRMNSGILSEEQKSKLSVEIEELKLKIENQLQEFKLELASDERQTIENLIGDLRAKISEYGKEKGYIMIFDKNDLIFSDTGLDITDEIVGYVNENNEPAP